MKSLEELDRWIAGHVKRWSSRAAGVKPSKELLEIRREILEDIRDRIEPKGEGKYFFPHNEVAIRIAAENEEQALVKRAAFSDDGGVERDIRELLVEANCRLPGSFRVAVEIVGDAELAASNRPFRIEYPRKKSAPTAKANTARPAAKLVVIRGSAEPAEFAIESNRVNLGRLQEVIGEKEGLRRRNDIAFAETEITVSREHAYLSFEPDSGKFRVCDCQSARGTRVFRGGRRIEVPRASTRGVQLQTGDEIHLGDARIRFEIPGP